MKALVPRLLFAMIGLVGCSELQPMKIAANSSLEQRREQYKQHEMAATMNVSVGGHWINYPRFSGLEDYMQESGCDGAAQKFSEWKKAQRWAWLPMAAGLIAFGVSQSPRNDFGIYGGISLMIGGTLAVELYARIKHLWPSVKAYNECIQKQLGLESDGVTAR